MIEAVGLPHSIGRCLRRRCERRARGADQRRNQQGLAGLDEVGIGEIVGRDQLIDGDAEALGDGAECIASLHDV